MKTRTIKFLSTILITLFFSNSIFSQSLIGVKTGCDFSEIFDNSDRHFNAKYKNDNTVSFGIFFKERKKKRLNLNWSLDYKAKSFDIESCYGHGSWTCSDLHFDLQFIGLSFIPELSFGTDFKFFINGGIFYDFLISSKVKGKYKNGDILGNDSSWIEEKTSDEFDKNNFGILIGLGFDIPISNNFNIIIESNYNIGIRNICSGSLGSYAEFMNFKNLNFSLGIAYRLNSFNI